MGQRGTPSRSIQLSFKGGDLTNQGSSKDVLIGLRGTMLICRGSFIVPRVAENCGSGALPPETAEIGGVARAPKSVAVFTALCAVDIKNPAFRLFEATLMTPPLLLKIDAPESNPPITKKTATINGLLPFFIFLKLY